MIVAVGIREEVAAERRQSRSCCRQPPMKSFKVIGERTKLSLKTDERRRKHDVGWQARHVRLQLDATSGMEVSLSIKISMWGLSSSLLCQCFLPTRPASSQVSHLDVELRVLVKVVKEFLIVGELGVPLARFCVSEVVTERNEKHRRAKEAGLLTVLIQQHERPEETDNIQRRKEKKVSLNSTWTSAPEFYIYSIFNYCPPWPPSLYSPIMDILLCDCLRRYIPRTGDPPPRQAVEVKLATDRRVWTTCVRHVVAVKWHHVTCDVTTGGGI